MRSPTAGPAPTRAWASSIRPGSTSSDADRAGPKAPYYFAPQAALQQGYLAQRRATRPRPGRYFSKALNYPWHEYKNSTDAKANLALRELGAKP